MFFLKELKHTVRLHPTYFGPNLMSYVNKTLCAAVEGKCSGTDGFVIAVVGVISNGRGNLESRTGLALFETRYRAIVFRPFKGEVMDVVANEVTQFGIKAEAGPLNLFVAHHHIPTTMKFVAHPPSFVSDDSTIVKGTKLRVLLLGTNIELESMFAVASIRDNYLGIIV